jgi:hypothetical protein
MIIDVEDLQLQTSIVPSVMSSIHFRLPGSVEID